MDILNTNSFVLVTGGIGFIGSHTAYTLLQSGYNVMIIDNFSNTSEINRIGLDILHEQLQNKTALMIENVDLRNYEKLYNVFQRYNIDSIIHFAALKSVGESVQKPLLYYENNIVGSMNLIQCAIEFKVDKFIFSSSATVYGSEIPPFREETSKVGMGITNPYGRTKMMVEEILQDVHKVSKLNVVLLRYFNPIGAHPSGLLGEVPLGTPNNLFPYILDVAEGKRTSLQLFGNDYDTFDGTCIRDFIHVMDLADGHCQALQFLDEMKDKKICQAVNLGTGIGTSVLDLIRTFEEINSVKIPYTIVERRQGDVSKSYADARKAERLLGWSAKRNLMDMCKDGWNFRQKNKFDFF